MGAEGCHDGWIAINCFVCDDLYWIFAKINAKFDTQKYSRWIREILMLRKKYCLTIHFLLKKGLFLDWYIEGIEEWIPLAVTRPFSTLAEATNHCWSLGSKQPLRQLKINVWFKSLQFPNGEIRTRFTYKNPVIHLEESRSFPWISDIHIYLYTSNIGIKSWNLKRSTSHFPSNAFGSPLGLSTHHHRVHWSPAEHGIRPASGRWRWVVVFSHFWGGNKGRHVSCIVLLDIWIFRN